MDCVEFRQMVTGDPSTAEGEAHLESCADCRDYLEQVHALDAKLKKAMAIDVPPLSMPELPEIETGNVVSLSMGPSISCNSNHAKLVAKPFNHLHRSFSCV